uniref:Uncharacterized protein n=1 Tax=candidate division WOR-3 bacterium TaxID=2052148 RepID=A0A7C4Y4U6_UNCW3
MSRIFLLIYILFFLGCKKTTLKPVVESYIPWNEKFSRKIAEGDLIVISPEKSVSASFNYVYDNVKRELTGSIVAIFGIKVANFRITDKGIYVSNNKGDTLSLQKIISSNIIPADVFINCVTYHFPFINDQRVTRMEVLEGELLSFNNYNLLLNKNSGYPLKTIYIIQKKKIEAQYNDIRSIQGTYQPFNVVMSSGNYKLEIRFKNIRLE